MLEQLATAWIYEMIGARIVTVKLVKSVPIKTCKFSFC